MAEASEGRKIVAIPITWMVYSLPANVFEIMGASVQSPPLVVAESLVESGQGIRVKKIETGIEIEDSDTEEKSDESGPWYTND